MPGWYDFYTGSRTQRAAESQAACHNSAFTSCPWPNDPPPAGPPCPYLQNVENNYMYLVGMLGVGEIMWVKY